MTKETHNIKVNDLSFHIVKFEDLEGFQIWQREMRQFLTTQRFFKFIKVE